MVEGEGGQKYNFPLISLICQLKLRQTSEKPTYLEYSYSYVVQDLRLIGI